MKQLIDFKKEILDSLLKGEIRNVDFCKIKTTSDVEKIFKDDCCQFFEFDYKNGHFTLNIEKTWDGWDGPDEPKYYVTISLEGYEEDIYYNEKYSNPKDALQFIIDKGLDELLKEIYEETYDKIEEKNLDNCIEAYDGKHYTFKVPQEEYFINQVYKEIKESEFCKTNNIKYENFSEYTKNLTSTEVKKVIGYKEEEYKELYNKLLPRKVDEMTELDKDKYENIKLQSHPENCYYDGDIKEYNNKGKTFTEFKEILKDEFNVTDEKQLKNLFNRYSNEIEDYFEKTDIEDDTNDIENNIDDDYDV
jgi:hypothetical protein